MAAPTDAAAGLPSGTVTFLFTDIEGSTALWDRHPDAMQVALARHDACLRNAIQDSNGSVVKATGDGVLAVFARAGDALRACLAAQRALQAGGCESGGDATPGDDPRRIALKVRMGLHSGVAELRDGDYFGSALNRAARIMALAHGEQVLMSAITAGLLASEVPDGIALRDMGEHRLKGLGNPERVLQVVAADLRSDFPPLSSHTSRSLPAERDAFVGRREALDELARRLRAGARLVSVIGIGGTGKTRLVTRFGWSVTGDFEGGVWFCDLAPARTVDGIVHAVAQGLDVPLGKDDAVMQLGNAIAARGKCLVIVDNFEQVARFAEPTLGRWLDRAPEARFLVTTREVLGVSGEEVMALAPLPAIDAAALFRSRAESAKPGFDPGPEDRAAIAPLIALLEGLPLAIELAASRVRVMPPRVLLARMSERFKLLTSGGGRLDRQATLRAVFDWSWELLSAPEKSALAQLSVFEGGFTLSAVEAVVRVGAGADAPWTVDVLQSLVQKSLVRHVTDDRFDLLVSVQEYAAEHLRSAGSYGGSGPEALLDTQARHGAYFAALTHDEAVSENCADLDNFVVACRRAVARNDIEVAAGALEGAWAALRLRGPFSAALELVSAVAALPGLGTAACARVDYVAGRALQSLGKNAEAYARLEASATRARQVGNRRCECRALTMQSFIDTHRGRFESARTLIDAALAIVRELNDAELEGTACNQLGVLELHLGRLEQAVHHYECALVLARRIGDRHLEAAVLGNLGTSYEQMGMMDESQTHQEAALALTRALGNRRLEGNTLCNLGLLHQLQGRPNEAADFLEAALSLARELGNAHLECVVRCNLGIVYHGLHQLNDGLAHFEAALGLARALGDRRREGQFLSYLALLHAHRGAFDEARRCLDEGERLLRDAGDRVSLGILLCSRSETEQLAGCPGPAATALGAASVIASDVGAGADSELRLAIARVRALVPSTTRSPPQ